VTDGTPAVSQLVTAGFLATQVTDICFNSAILTCEKLSPSLSLLECLYCDNQTRNIVAACLSTN